MFERTLEPLDGGYYYHVATTSYVPSKLNNKGFETATQSSFIEDRLVRSVEVFDVTINETREFVLTSFEVVDNTIDVTSSLPVPVSELTGSLLSEQLDNNNPRRINLKRIDVFMFCLIYYKNK